MDLPGIVHSASDGVLEPKVAASRVARLSPNNFLQFLAVHAGAKTCGRKRKESRVRGGVCQVARGIIPSYFQYLGTAVKETRSGGILTQRGRVPRQCITEGGLGGKDRALGCVMCQGKVSWGERPGYTVA